jgi:SAM-dependent methyltransferase
MATEQVRSSPFGQGWATPPTITPDTGSAGLATPEPPRRPVDSDLVEVASAMVPGKALDLGCGQGQDSVWLAQRGWIVTAVDRSPSAVADARELARAAGVDRTIVFDVADLATWTPASRYDLVFCTFSLPARGMGRSRMLNMAAAAVAPGGTILLTDFDRSLGREGWMAEKHLVSLEELERHLAGFRVDRSAVRRVRHRHGYEERVLPAANIIATRRTDLREPF